MHHIRRACSISCGLLAALGVQHQTPAAQQTPSPPPVSAFSFDVYGDSRSMMYLPYRADQEADARKLIAHMLELVLPPKEAAAVVKKDVKLIYDPSNTMSWCTSSCRS